MMDLKLLIVDLFCENRNITKELWTLFLDFFVKTLDVWLFIYQT